jgi:hypothetical protein
MVGINVKRLFDKSSTLFRICVVVLIALFLTACKSADSDIAGVNLQTIEVSSGQLQTLPNRTSLQLVAAGNYSNAVRTNLTKTVVWESMDQAVATVAKDGLVSGVTEGVVMITASVPESGVIGSVEVTVTPAPLVSLEITPDLHSMPRGKTIQYKVTGTLLDDSELDYTEKVKWLSSDTGLATIGDVAGTKGLASAVVLSASDPLRAEDLGGETTILATFTDDYFGLVQDIDTLTVRPAELETLSVSPNSLVMNPLIIPGQQYTAMAVYSDGTTYDFTNSVSWASSTDAASPSTEQGSEGYVTGNDVVIGAEMVTITATGIIAGSDVEVVGTAQLTVTTAALERLDITPSPAELHKGTTLPLTATGVFADGLTQDLTEWADWASSDLAVLSVENVEPGSRGLVRGDSEGSATVTATVTVVGVVGVSDVTVTPSPLSTIVVARESGTGASSTIAMGNTLQLKATGYFEDGSNQIITNDVDWDVVWDSTDPVPASVSNTPGSKGLVTGIVKNANTVEIRATAGNTVNDSYPIQVTNPILNSITLETSANTDDYGETVGQIALNTRRQYRGIGHYSDGTQADLTQDGQTQFITNSTGVISVGGKGYYIACDGPDKFYRGDMGLVTALEVGTKSLQVQNPKVVGTTNDRSPLFAIKVTAAVLESITIVPADNIPLAVDEVRQYRAMGHFYDSSNIHSTQNITDQVIWSSDDQNVVSVENRDPGAICSNQPMPVSGRVTAHGTGNANIIAIDPVAPFVTSINREREITGSVPVIVQ